jgi:hypothetical protein
LRRRVEKHGQHDDRGQGCKIGADQDRQRRQHACGSRAARAVRGGCQRPQPARGGWHIAHRLKHLVKERRTHRQQNGTERSGERIADQPS